MKNNRTPTVLATVLAAALISIASLASAGDQPGNYVALKGGIYSPSTSYNIDNFNGGSTTRLDSKTGFSGEVAVGHYFLPMLALELGAGYFESKGSAAAQPGESTLKVVPLTATGKVLLPLGMFEPFGLFGIGAYVTNLNVHDNVGNVQDTSKVTYGLSVGAGFNINLKENLFVGVEGKYLWDDPSFGGQHIKLDGFITSAVIGFRL